MRFAASTSCSTSGTRKDAVSFSQSSRASIELHRVQIGILHMDPYSDGTPLKTRQVLLPSPTDRLRNGIPAPGLEIGSGEPGDGNQLFVQQFHIQVPLAGVRVDPQGFLIAQKNLAQL